MSTTEKIVTQSTMTYPAYVISKFSFRNILYMNITKCSNYQTLRCQTSLQVGPARTHSCQGKTVQKKSGIRNPAQRKVAMITINTGSISAVIGGVEMKVIQNTIARFPKICLFSCDLTLLNLCKNGIRAGSEPL